MRKLLLLLPLLILFSSCVQTPPPEIPWRVNYQFNVSNIGNTFTSNQDTLLINEVKMYVEKYNTQFADSSILQTKMNGFIMFYTPDLGEKDNVVISSNIGYRNVNGFTGFELFIKPPADGDKVNDNDFLGDKTNYSIIIKGNYDGAPFTYKSNTSYSRFFNFNRVELSDRKQTLVLRMLLDMRDVMIDNSGNIINPRKDSNKAVIDSLVKNTMNVQAYADNRTR